jgi:GNAT superfamily N-acetyltransferase
MFSVIEVNSQPAGSLWIQSRSMAIHIVELQVLPSVQRQGIGTGVVQGSMQRAASQAASLTLSVVPVNPGAKRLYERLGFSTRSWPLKLRFSAPAIKRFLDDVPLQRTRRIAPCQAAKVE